MTYVLIVKHMYEKHLCFKNHKYFVRLSSVSSILSLQNQISMIAVLQKCIMKMLFFYNSQTLPNKSFLFFASYGT